MCGIVGFKGLKKSIERESFEQMMSSITYRGPDDHGVWHNEKQNLTLGHLRLSIIDPTPSGHQPMFDSNDNYALVFNGEIYNYLEIKEKLLTKGYIFKTHTDTEVIIIAYQEYGLDCLTHFNGMFSLALWDNKQQSLFLARDRLGIKPLYYQLNEKGLIFASEVKSIIKSQTQCSKFNEHLIDSYMTFGYIPGEDTLQKGIKRLKPGHYAIYKNNQLTFTQYWDLNFNNDTDKGLDFYLEKSQDLLNNSIDLRLRSDVPLGIFLSGGLDSSAVVGLLSNRVSEPLKTFSVSYDFGKQFNETEYARLISKKFKTEHHEITVTPSQFKEFIPEYVSLMDEPVTEAAAISLFFVSKLAKEQVTVVLSGEGSDEIFAGYDLYQYMLTIEKYRTLLGSNITSLISGIGNALLPNGNKLLKYLKMGGTPLEKRYKGISVYEDYHKDLLYKKSFKQLIIDKKQSSVNIFLENLYDSTKEQDALSKMLYYDTKTWLVDDLLIKADRMSMANSLELRVPFLDYRLVEFAATIPSKYKVKNNEGKYILKKMMENILPKEIIYRKKMGFPTPLKLMFQHELQNYASELLLDSNNNLSQYFSTNRIEQLLKEHKQDKFDHHRILWQLVVLEEWLKQNT